MNSSHIFFYLNKFSKNLLYFIFLFSIINFEVSLNLFSIFDYSPPSLISIIIFISIRKYSINYSNFILFILGLIYDIILGVNLGSNTILFLLIKYLTHYIKSSFSINNNNNDWFYFTGVFLTSFLIIFLINIFLNMVIPDFGPVLFHIGITLIFFPLILIFLNLINFLTNFLEK